VLSLRSFATAANIWPSIVAAVAELRKTTGNPYNRDQAVAFPRAAGLAAPHRKGLVEGLRLIGRKTDEAIAKRGRERLGHYSAGPHAQVDPREQEKAIAGFKFFPAKFKLVIKVSARRVERHL
jgi:hypothetical protein